MLKPFRAHTESTKAFGLFILGQAIISGVVRTMQALAFVSRAHSENFMLLQVNQRGLKLHCSHYKPFDTTAEHGRPIVIYCHCNSGSRRDAEEAFYILLPRDVTVFCLDFAVRFSCLLG